MFTVDLTLATVLYTGVGLLVIAGLWLWFDRRDRAFYDGTRKRVTFHCIKCDRTYTSTGPADESRCPGCGHENTRLKF